MPLQIETEQCTRCGIFTHRYFDFADRGERFCEPCAVRDYHKRNPFKFHTEYGVKVPNHLGVLNCDA